MTSPRVLFATSSALLLLLSGCSGSSDSPTVSAPTEAPSQPSSTPPTDSSPTITIKQFRYTPLQVAPGTTITVKNLDDAEHTVTSDTKDLFEADDVGGDPKTFKAPAKAGTYTFHCKYHASMHGSLTVT
jgi:plastocyanin